MGLLDDAIREHLDLKRRRGADPSEIERAEREALGPVRRGPEEAEQPGNATGLTYDHEEEEDDWGEPFDEGVDEAEEPARGEPEAFAAEPPPFVGEPQTPSPPARSEPQEEPFEDDEPFAEPSARRTPPPPHPSPAPHPAPGSPQVPAQPDPGETMEYDVGDALEGHDKEDGEDVLEETPEFLHDTPDHDRLWFEQRPPRDFDFDG